VSDTLHYRGDHSNFDPDHIMGPDMFGACYRPVAGEYDAGTNLTALQLVPIPPDDLQERVIIRSLERRADTDRIQRTEQLFGTGAA
jgi:hypothetical protein